MSEIQYLVSDLPWVFGSILRSLAWSSVLPSSGLSLELNSLTLN